MRTKRAYKLNGEDLFFIEANITMEERDITDVFAQKNNKTLRETLDNKRYRKFADSVFRSYPSFFDWSLGDFLIHLKNRNDQFYLDFLNPYGDRSFCTFSVDLDNTLDNTGMYAFVKGNQIVYIGRCRDSFRKRFKYGYGKINPKNCYLDGQSTNCRINSLINQERGVVSIYLNNNSDREYIEVAEKELIRIYSPAWNIVGR